MMTAEEILQEIHQLPVEEQLSIVQTVLETLDEDEIDLEPAIDAPPFLSLAGVLNPQGREITDAEVEDMIVSYLEEKVLRI